MAPRLITGIFLAAIGIFLATLAVQGCKQGLGELCQVNDDCETGLCNSVTGRCQEDVVTAADAAPTLDATPPADAPDVPADAATDAGTDAGIDAQTLHLTE